MLAALNSLALDTHDSTDQHTNLFDPQNWCQITLSDLRDHQAKLPKQALALAQSSSFGTTATTSNLTPCTTNPPTSTTAVQEFNRNIKHDLTTYPVLKTDEQWPKFK